MLFTCYTRLTRSSYSHTSMPVVTQDILCSILMYILIITFQTRCNDYSYSIPPLMVLCVISTIVNIKVLICAFWIRHPQTPTLLISLSLALADALTSAFSMIALLVSSYLPCFNVYAPYEFRIITEVVRLSGLLVTVGHLFALSCNHYMGILKPLHHHTLITTKKVIAVLVLLWVLPTAFISSYFISDPTTEFIGRYELIVFFIKRNDYANKLLQNPISSHPIFSLLHPSYDHVRHLHPHFNRG